MLTSEVVHKIVVIITYWRVIVCITRVVVILRSIPSRIIFHIHIAIKIELITICLLSNGNVNDIVDFETPLYKCNNIPWRVKLVPWDMSNEFQKWPFNMCSKPNMEVFFFQRHLQTPFPNVQPNIILKY